MRTRKKKIKKTSVKLFKWFHENGMKANQDKCHFLSSLDISAKSLLPTCIPGSQKLLGVTIDSKLNFNEHIASLCKKTSRKVQAVARTFPQMP